MPSVKVHILVKSLTNGHLRRTTITKTIIIMAVIMTKNDDGLGVHLVLKGLI